jgi:hypothetical protein
MKRFNSWQKVLFWVTIYSVAMGLLESVVVIYLRAIYYPIGFCFPLTAMDPRIVMSELSRETATIIMLLSIGAIAGKNFTQRFGYFVFSFALWDIFYYLFLKLLIHWPVSLFTWDILFMIPSIWTSPVIYPIIVSLSMIILGLIVIKGSESDVTIKFDWKIWTLLITGSFIVIFSFMLDFIKYLHKYINFKQYLAILKHTSINRVAEGYIPGNFNWFLFLIGELIILAGICFVVIKYRSTAKLAS